MTTLDQTPFQKFLAGLEVQLRQLPFSNQLAFSTACCERALPNYISFSESQHWGKPDALKSCIDKAWKIVCEGLAPTKMGDPEEEVKAVTPDSDDFPGADVTAAQEAALMVTLLVQFCRKREPSYAVRIATFARDTIALHIETAEGLEPSDPTINQKIASHPLMLKELDRQKADLNALKDIRSDQELCDFRGQATQVKASNIGVTTSY